MLNHPKPTATAIAIAIAASAAALVPAAPAGATTTKHVSITEVFRALVAPSAQFVATGTVSGTGIGSGAVVRNVTTTAGGLSVKFTLYTKRGSLSGTASETRTAQPDGSVAFQVTRATITSGTGRYAGARGRLTGSGTEPETSSPVTLKMKGTIRY